MQSLQFFYLFRHYQNIKSLRLLGVFLCGLLCLAGAHADTSPVEEYKIKAGYIFNFTKFITWSEEANTETFNICIVGNDPFGDAINGIEQHSAFNHPIKLLRLSAINQEPHCHIVYVGAGGNVKAATLGKNILTVGEEAPFIKQCGMIAFVKQQDKIKLQINLKQLQKSGLKVSAKLLEVSELVQGCGHD
ncbi:MAG: YfiR family protein [Methylococcales bacterium]|nr:YfiR family protein [Methylococcales bacterium]